jgi:hypothetical protein
MGNPLPLESREAREFAAALFPDKDLMTYSKCFSVSPICKRFMADGHGRLVSVP